MRKFVEFKNMIDETIEVNAEAVKWFWSTSAEDNRYAAVPRTTLVFGDDSLTVLGTRQEVHNKLEPKP